MKERGVPLIAMSGLLYGGITVGGSLLSKEGLSAFDISFFFLSLSLVPIFPFVLSKNFLLKVVGSWKYLSAYSLVNSGLVLLQFESLSLGLSPAVSALLLYTQPIWTVILGRAFFSEKVGSGRVMVIVLALVGAFLISNPTDIFRNGSSFHFYGDIAALSGAIFLSIWIILGKKGRLDVFQRPVELVFAVRGSTLLVVSAVSLIFVASGEHLFFSNPALISENILPLLGFAIVTGTLPDFLFYSGIAKVETLRAGVVLLLEPISSAVISVVLLISIPNWMQIVGGALILLSNYFVNRPVPGQLRDWKHII